MHEASSGSARKRTMLIIVVLIVGALAAVLAATASARPAAKTISVAIVANPQMQDIASLTPSLFTAKSGIKVKYTILDEGKLREVTTRDVGSGGKAFDAVMIGPYEAPQFGTAGLLHDLTPMAKADKTYNYGGLQVFVDQASLLYLDGAEVDYVETLEGAGFKFNNPQVKSTCGCGSSFQV